MDWVECPENDDFTSRRPLYDIFPNHAGTKMLSI